MVKSTLIRWGMKLMYPALKYYYLEFLKTENVEEKQMAMLRTKLEQQSKTNIGKKLEIKPDSLIENIPLTSYGFYREFFSNPEPDNLIYPLDDYVKVSTSGSMGRPKTYLIPKSSIWYNIKTCGFSFLLLATHDGSRINFEIGDIIYRNTPGGTHLSGFIDDVYQQNSSEMAAQVPDINLSYDEKIQYFIDNHENIDVAYMTVNALMDEIYPKIKKPIHLKALITHDTSARVLKEEIKKITGNYPKTSYGATETNLVGQPSVEYPACFFFDYRMAYYEFLPESEALGPDVDMLDPPPKTVKMNEVEVGKRYQLIITPFKNDLTRYIMPDILECVSKRDSILDVDMPVFAFYGRADRLIVMHNFTRIAEEEILLMLKNADIPFVDFTARVELDDTREYLTLYMEISKDIPVDEIADKVHQQFMGFDKDYRDLSNMMKYVPFRVSLLKRGTFAEYMRVKNGMARVQRIGMREERLELLKNLIKD